MTFDRSKWADDIKQQIAHVGSGFTEPDEDWLSMLFAVTESEDGKTGLGLGAIDPSCFASEESKDALARQLPAILAELRATAYALLLPVYMLREDVPAGTSRQESREQAAETLNGCEGSLGNHPDSEERLLLVVCDTKGANVYTAPVLRDGEQPPVLGAWEDWSDAEFEGRFAGALGSNPIANWAEPRG